MVDAVFPKNSSQTSLRAFSNSMIWAPRGPSWRRFLSWVSSQSENLESEISFSPSNPWLPRLGPAICEWRMETSSRSNGHEQNRFAQLLVRAININLMWEMAQVHGWRKYGHQAIHWLLRAWKIFPAGYSMVTRIIHVQKTKINSWDSSSRALWISSCVVRNKNLLEVKGVIAPERVWETDTSRYVKYSVRTRLENTETQPACLIHLNVWERHRSSFLCSSDLKQLPHSQFLRRFQSLRRLAKKTHYIVLAAQYRRNRFCYQNKPKAARREINPLWFSTRKRNEAWRQRLSIRGSSSDSCVWTPITIQDSLTDSFDWAPHRSYYKLFGACEASKIRFLALLGNKVFYTERPTFFVLGAERPRHSTK